MCRGRRAQRPTHINQQRAEAMVAHHGAAVLRDVGEPEPHHELLPPRRRVKVVRCELHIDVRPILPDLLPVRPLPRGGVLGGVARVREGLQNVHRVRAQHRRGELLEVRHRDGRHEVLVAVDLGGVGVGVAAALVGAVARLLLAEPIPRALRRVELLRAEWRAHRHRTIPLERRQLRRRDRHRCWAFTRAHPPRQPATAVTAAAARAMTSLLLVHLFVCFTSRYSYNESLR